MPTHCAYLPYHKTGYFSKLVTDYLQQDAAILPFIAHQPTTDGIVSAITERKRFNTNRKFLVDELRAQYNGLPLNPLQEKHLGQLLQPDTFTICTAHQPNLFTGHLYFIYKILHTIKLAAELNRQMPEYNFVPVYYMGSEDADLDELGHINLNGEKLEWATKQTGPVGKMIIDQQLVSLISQMEGQLAVLPHGSEVIRMLKDSYEVGQTIQQATLILVNKLFASYGLLVLIPDNANLKRAFNQVVKRELTEQFSHKLVEQTAASLSEHYKVQASGREINLFYLQDQRRDRIVKEGEVFRIPGQDFTSEQILEEVDNHPERFSANVILRGVFQEMILPNIAFIGGGGEIAYWLELKAVFEACDVPFPVLLVRNSFLLVDENSLQNIQKHNLTNEELFKTPLQLTKQLVKKNSGLQLTLTLEQQQLRLLYEHMADVAGKVDVSLVEHVQALFARTSKTIIGLEKKMLRAEKRKYESTQRQISQLKNKLFPNGSLQERIDNFSPFFARYGKRLFDLLLSSSLTVEPEFGIIYIEEEH